MLDDIKAFFKEYKGIIKEHIKEDFELCLKFLISNFYTILEIILAIYVFEYISQAVEEMYLGNYTSPKHYGLFDLHYWTSFILLLFYMSLRDLMSNIFKIIKKRGIDFNLENILKSALLAIVISFVVNLIFRDFGKDISLFANSFYTQKKTKEEFKIKRISENRIKLIHHNFGKLSRRKYVDLVDKHRISKGLNSVYKLENNDTILVTFTKGFYDELYLR